MPLRAAGVCGLLASVTFIVGLVAGDLAQPDAFSPANDDISDLGARTADSAWLYNQLAANLNGLLIIAFALGLWRFLEGFLRLDCRGMDEGCENDSWQSDGHGIESGISAALFFLAPLLLAFAFRRLPQWRDLWLPTILTVPVIIAASVLFSFVGDGAATRAGSIVWFLWLALVAVRLLRESESGGVRTPV